MKYYIYNLGVKLRPIIIWFQKKKKKFLTWVDETNIFLYCCRKMTCIYLFYTLLFNYKLNIVFSIFISYSINRYCWDILVTWFYIDYVYGIIYKNTENLQSFKNTLTKIKKYFIVKSNKSINKIKVNKYFFNKIINIYLFIIIIFILLNNYNIYHYIYIMIYIIYLYNILDCCKYNNLIYYINKYIIHIYNSIKYFLNLIKFIFVKKINNVKIDNYNIHKYILNIILNYCMHIKHVYNNYIKNKLNDNKILDYKIFIYNKKLKIKFIKYNLYLFLIYFLDNFEYHLKLNKNLYKNRNIIKLFKIPKNFNPINSKLEQIIKLKQHQIYNSINSSIKYYLNILLDCINIHQIKPIKLKSPWNFKFNKKIAISSESINKINKVISMIYNPINCLNYIISDISLSTTYLLIYFKKKYILNVAIICIYYLINKIKLYLVHYTKLLVSYSRAITYLIISKTIYITLIICYFYNKDFSVYILYNIYNEFVFDKLIFISNLLYINIILNINCIYVLTTILGLQLVLYWSKTIHRLFGRYLWTMAVFPVFLESHKILYYKLLCINLLNFNTFDFIFLLKYKILDLFNFKIYNIYQTLTISILILLLIFFIKVGAFKHIYASLLYSRWSYIKYPIYIYIFEVFRLKIVEYLSLFILYLNLKYNIYIVLLKTLVNLSNSTTYLYVSDFIQEFIWELNQFNYYNLYNLFIPNMFVLNIVIDLIIIYISIKWLITYSNQYKKVDLKFVAFPLVTAEIILKYYFIYLGIYYFSQYIYSWIIDSTILWHLFRVSLLSLIYLEIRVHKIPRKTMPWYFRQIVELWPSTYFNQWYTNEYLYIDQQRYIVLRFRLKTFKILYKDVYKKLEIWNKIIILNYQKEKDKVTRQLTAFCRVMSRKENMLREINNFEYQGWYEDWEYNYNKINIYSWKLDIWDKPYMYQFKKTVFFSNIKFHFFFYNALLERYSMKYMHLTYLFFFTNLLDFYYTNKYIYILDRDDTANLVLRDWKKKFYNNYDEQEEYTHLKKLKLVLMSFSSGESIKTPDWIFPPQYEKKYKTEGWSMFESQEIDQVELDWRPDIKDLN